MFLIFSLSRTPHHTPAARVFSNIIAKRLNIIPATFVYIFFFRLPHQYCMKSLGLCLAVHHWCYLSDDDRPGFTIDANAQLKWKVTNLWLEKWVEWMKCMYWVNWTTLEHFNECVLCVCKICELQCKHFFTWNVDNWAFVYKRHIVCVCVCVDYNLCDTIPHSVEYRFYFSHFGLIKIRITSWVLISRYCFCCCCCCHCHFSSNTFIVRGISFLFMYKYFMTVSLTC